MLARVAISLLVLVSARAHAADVPCAPAEKGTITLDGLLDDWHEVTPLAAGDENAGVSLRCNVEGKTLYLAVGVTDDRVIRTKQARPGEDHLVLTLGGKAYSIYPTSGAYKGKVTPSGARLASATSEQGFVVELAFSFAKVGLGRNPERLPFSLRFDDCDAAVTLKTERSVSLAGELSFIDGPSVLDGFLADRSLSRSLVRWQHPARAAGGVVQLVLAGRYVAMISDGYAFVELPVADGKDVQAPQLVDLAGDGHEALLLRYTERGEGGAREVLAAFRPIGSELHRVFAVEVGASYAFSGESYQRK